MSDETGLLLPPLFCLFFFNDTATTEIYTLSLHDALPISSASPTSSIPVTTRDSMRNRARQKRSEEHTSELQSHHEIVCRLLLEKKKTSHGDARLEQLSRPHQRSSGQRGLYRGHSKIWIRVRGLSFLMMRPPPRCTLFPYTTLFR